MRRALAVINRLQPGYVLPDSFSRNFSRESKSHEEGAAPGRAVALPSAAAHGAGGAGGGGVRIDAEQVRATGTRRGRVGVSVGVGVGVGVGVCIHVLTRTLSMPFLSLPPSRPPARPHRSSCGCPMPSSPSLVSGRALCGAICSARGGLTPRCDLFLREPFFARFVPRGRACLLVRGVPVHKLS